MRGATEVGAASVEALVFQSSHPMRGATYPNSADRLSTLFQSSHPMRGATAAIVWPETLR